MSLDNNPNQSQESLPFDTFLVGDPINLSEDSTSLNAISSELAYNSVEQEYVAVWRFSGNNGGDLSLQRFSSTGDLIEGNILIPEDGNFINDPDITYNSLENQYLLSYWNNAPDSNPGLFGQLLTVDGASIGNNLFLSDVRFEPSFVYNPNQNEYFQTSRRFPGENAIFGQRIDSDGSLLGSTIRIDSVGDAAPNGEVAFNNIDNQYLATWRNQSDLDIVGRLISADGSFLSDQFNIVEKTDIGENTELVFSINTVFDSTNTQFLVAYGIPETGHVEAQLVDADGSLIGDEIIVFDQGYEISGNDLISVAFSQELGIYLLVATTDSGLLGQFISDSGSLIDDSFVISSRNDIFQNSVVYNRDQSQFAVSWNFNFSDEGIFAQLINPPTSLNDITGTPGDDRLRGTNNNDSILGLAGDDRIRGRNGDDQILGGPGDDRIRGNNGNDTLMGGAGNDVLFGNNGSDIFVLALGEGTDIIWDFDLSESDQIGLAGGLQFNQLSFESNQILLGTEVLAEVRGFDTSSLSSSDFVTI